MKKIFYMLVIISIASFAQQKRAITIDDLWAMQRIGDFSVSPNGEKIIFAATSYSMEKNKGNSDIWIVNNDGSNQQRIIASKENEYQPIFIDNNKIAFIRDGNLWYCNAEGKNQKKVSDFYSGISGIEFEKENNNAIFVSEVYPFLNTQNENKKRDEEIEKNEVKAKIFTELMYKHWNRWRGEKRSHLFYYDIKKNKFTDLTAGNTTDIPPIDLGSGNDYSLSPDGKEIAFTMNTDKVIALSTNNDVFIAKIDDLLKGKLQEYKKISISLGSDNQPVYSPDGNYIAFRSMERAGFEADKQSLILYNRKTGSLKNLTKDIDISFGEIIWSNNSKVIYFIAANQIYNSIYKLNINNSKVEPIIENVVASNISLSADGKKLFFKNQKSTLPNEIFSINTSGKNLTQITSINKELLSKIEMNDVETFWSEGAEGKKVEAIIVKPPFFNPEKKYPLIFLIHGGPQGHWEDDFHYRWNLQMFAAPGYIVVAPNPRGSVGYGQQFTDEISGDWGGKAYIDLMNTYDYAIENYKFIDKEKTFAAGASYGGYMINWIEGHTDRFKALVCHAGVYNLESMYGVTEELWFSEWELGGTPWDNPESYAKWSPSKYVNNFKTPMLIIHGAYDFRVPEGQAFELFTALQRKGIESKLLYFPDEYHFVTKPQNAKLWWNTIYDWFKKF